MKFRIIFSLFLIIIICTNEILSNKHNYGIDFQIRGVFYLTLVYLFYGVIHSKYFRKILLYKETLFLGILLFFSIILGIFNNNEFYFIKDDLYKILLVYAGILSPLLICENNITIKPGIISLIMLFYFFTIFNSFIVGEINLGSKNLNGSTFGLFHMFIPLFFMHMVQNKIVGQSNIKYFMLLLLIFSFELFIAQTRTNILGLLISVFLYMGIGYNKNTFQLNLVKKIIFSSITFWGLVALAFIMRSVIYDRIASDNYRLFESMYIYKYYIADSLLYGDGLGKTFIVPFTSQLGIEKAAHLGYFTILLKFGLVGLVLALILILTPMAQYFLFSNSKEIYTTKKQIILVPSLALWFFTLSVSNGTFYEPLFGLGLAIGGYLHFSNQLNFNLKILNQPTNFK